MLESETLDGDDITRLADEAMGYKAGGERRPVQPDGLGTPVPTGPHPAGATLSGASDGNGNAAPAAPADPPEPPAPPIRPPFTPATD